MRRFVPCIGDVSVHLFGGELPRAFVPCIGDVSVGEHVNLELRLFSLFRGCFC